MKTFLLITATLALIVGITYMFFTLPNRAFFSKVNLVIGIDASESVRPQMGDYLVLVKSLLEELRSEQDSLTLYRVDDTVNEFSDGLYDGDMERTLTGVVAEVKDHPAKRGTYPAKFWRHVADNAEQSRVPVVILLMSDGDNDDMTAQAIHEMKVAAKRLAQCKRVSAVALCGASSANWESLKTIFQPLGERFHLWTPSDMNTEKPITLLRKAQQN